MIRALTSTRVVLPEADGLRVGPARIDMADGIITAVGPAGPGEGVLDLGDKLIAPAWVNAHTHLAMQPLRALGGDDARGGNVVEDLWFRIESALQPGDVRAFARIGALECLVAGTGAVFDHYYQADELARALTDVGLEGMVAPTLQDCSGPGAHAWEAALQTTADLHADAGLAASGVHAALGPHATDTVSDALWARLTSMARDLRLPVHVHVAQSFEEHARAREAGHRSAVARLFADERLAGVPRALLVHLVLMDEADLGLFDPGRDVAVHCPASQLQFAFPADVRALAERVPLALGTDAGACNDAMDVQRELLLLAHGPAYALTFDPFAGTLDERAAHLSAARRAQHERRVPHVDPAAVLASVTRVPGSVHQAATWGVVAPGARACLSVFDLDHPAMWPAVDPLRALAFGGATQALHTVITGGRVVGEVGRPSAVLATDRVRDFVTEATARRAALLSRAGVVHA